MENKYIKNNSKKRVEILVPIDIYEKLIKIKAKNNTTVAKIINQLIKDNINKL